MESQSAEQIISSEVQSVNIVTPATSTTTTATTTAVTNSPIITTSQITEQQQVDIIPTVVSDEDEDDAEENYDDVEEIFGENVVKTDSKLAQLRRGGKNEDIDEESEEKSFEDERQSAELSFQERLRERFKKFRQSHSGVLGRKTDSNNNRPRVTSTEEEDDEEDEGEDNDKKRPKFGQNGRTSLIRKKLAQVESLTSPKYFFISHIFSGSASHSSG